MRKKKNQLKCPYCGSPAVLRNASFVHGSGALDEHLYVCTQFPVCDAYVSVHKGTLIPRGSPANGDLRHKRILAHRALSQLWQTGIMSKRQAYCWMQDRFCLTEEQAHIGNYSEYRCDELIKAANEVACNNLRKIRRAEYAKAKSRAV